MGLPDPVLTKAGLNTNQSLRRNPGEPTGHTLMLYLEEAGLLTKM